MKNKIKSLTILLILTLSCKTLDLDKSLVFNPKIETGTLDNGVSYFIQENAKPENRIELRLIVKAGSINEDDDQRGLAHFVEHMAFNGTKNFQKDSLVKYLESLGMGFGPEINAYTTFDETVYKLSIPSDNPEILENAFQILEDWAHQVSFEDEEIEKERGVIVEEWRGGRGVKGRYLDELLPILLKESRYANRLTIGDMDVIQNCDPQRLRDFYNDWYRPESMAVAVVGNLFGVDTKALISKYFSFTKDSVKRERISKDTPILDRTAVKIIPDPEKTSSDFNMFIKKRANKIETEKDYRDYISEILGIFMFNSRLEEIYTKADSSFISAGTGTNSFTKDLSMSVFYLKAKEGRVLEGFESLLVEIERVNQHGFNSDELDRAKSQLSLILNSMYNERDNVESSSILEDIVNYYLEGDIVMDISYEVSLLNSFIEDITVDEVNSKSANYFSGIDKTITLQIPKDSIKVPTEDDILALFSKVSGESYSKRESDKELKPLFDRALEPGVVVRKELDSETGVTTIVLNNGVFAYLKPTDFMADEINFSGISFGGLSLVDDSEYFSGQLAASVVTKSGLNGLDFLELDKVLSGKNASVKPWISNYTEGLRGSSNKADKEIMFQLINLFFTAPEFSQESYDVITNNLKDYIKNRSNSPDTIYGDRIKEILGSGHFRSKPINIDSLNEISLAEVEKIYKERFNDPSDFKFVFTGSFEVDEMIPLIEKYLGSIETLNTKESPKDIGVRFPDGVIQESINKGIEEKSQVEIIFNGDFTGSENDEFAISLLSNYLEEVLRVKIRENLSGTYGVSVFSKVNYYPRDTYIFGIYFGCEPGREDELTSAIFDEIESLKEGSIDQEGFDSVKENFLRSMELNLKDNGYWLNGITEQMLLNRDLSEIINEDISFVTKELFVELAKKYIDNNKFVKVILKPE